MIHWQNRITAAVIFTAVVFVAQSCEADSAPKDGNTFTKLRLPKTTVVRDQNGIKIEIVTKRSATYAEALEASRFQLEQALSMQVEESANVADTWSTSILIWLYSQTGIEIRDCPLEIERPYGSVWQHETQVQISQQALADLASEVRSRRRMLVLIRVAPNLSAVVACMFLAKLMHQLDLRTNGDRRPLLLFAACVSLSAITLSVYAVQSFY